jgi:hypothetical protein
MKRNIKMHKIIVVSLEGSYNDDDPGFHSGMTVKQFDSFKDLANDPDLASHFAECGFVDKSVVEKQLGPAKMEELWFVFNNQFGYHRGTLDGFNLAEMKDHEIQSWAEERIGVAQMLSPKNLPAKLYAKYKDYRDEYLKRKKSSLLVASKKKQNAAKRKIEKAKKILEKAGIFDLRSTEGDTT